MTSGEMKFALRVEGALNTIPEPEFRQLMVEALMVLSLIVEYNIVQHFGGTINVEDIVRMANKMFLQDQVRLDGPFRVPFATVDERDGAPSQFKSKGDSTLCCARSADGEPHLERKEGSRRPSTCCGGAARVCRHFYDSAPSGTFGTMSYMVRACCVVLDAVPKEGDIDCQVS